MATNQTHASADRQTHPLLNQLREMHVTNPATLPKRQIETPSYFPRWGGVAVAPGPPGPRKDASAGLGQLAAVTFIGFLPPRRTVP